MNSAVSTDELTNHPLLRGINQADLDWLVHHSDVINLEKDSVVLSPNEDNDTIFIVMNGRLVVEFGRHQGGMLTHIDQGGWVGEMSVIDKVRPSATVMTESNAQLLAIHSSVWWELIDRSHVAARNFLHALTSRLRQNNKLIADGMQKQHVFFEKAHTDSLTGLRNRYWLEERLPLIIQNHQLEGSPCSLLMMDIDHFKQFNDRYGHLAGDRVLQTVATIVSGNLREGDVAIRYGGEELILIFPETSIQNAEQIARRLGEIIRTRKVESDDGNALPPVTVSIGVYMIAKNDTPDKILGRVDAAMYQAKNAGRDRVVVWQDK